MATVFQPKYAASASVNFSTNLNSLGSSSTWVAGVQSDQIDNSSNLYDDVLLSGQIKLGTSPAASSQINIYVVACMDAGSTYPDTITGAGTAAKTWTSANVQNAGAKLLKSMLTDSTTGRIYYFSNESVAALFGGVVPQKFIVFVAQNTGAALDGSAGGSMNALGVQWQGV